MTTGQYIGAGQCMTMADFARRTDPKGQAAALVNLMEQVDDLPLHLLWLEGNDGDGHETTVVNGLPAPVYRAFGEGVLPTAGATSQLRHQCGLLEDLSQIDEALAKKNGNSQIFFVQESALHIQGMSQKFSGDFIYADITKEPRGFHGLQNYYSTLNTAKAASATNVIDGGGTGNTNTSVYLTVFGPMTTHAFFPQGGKPGLDMVRVNDGKPEMALDKNGKQFRAYKVQFKMQAGLAVRNWRYNARLCNLDVAALQAGSIDVGKLLLRLCAKIPKLPKRISQVQKTDDPFFGTQIGRPALIMNRSVKTALVEQMWGKSNVLFRPEEWDGVQFDTFNSVPICMLDALRDDEPRVT